MTIDRETRTEVLRLYHAEKWKIGTIARQLGVHHGTVRRVLRDAEEPRQRKPRRSKLDPFIPFIQQTLKKYPKLPASRLYEMVCGRGYRGSQSHFRRVIASLRPKPEAEAYLRLKTLPGEQSQVDWAHFGKVRIGRAERPLMAFVMVLSYSRRIFLRFYLGAAMSNFLRGHIDAFEAWQGVPREIWCDNLKSVVIERRGTAVHFNPRYLDFAAHYRFLARPVAIARGNEKGRVERASRRKTYLIAFIDDATRVIPFAAFAMAENVQAFLPVFKNALIRRGLPARLYVDNGSAYRSRHLSLVCARLGVALIHARAFQPAGKGKIERFFRTLRAGWLRHLGDDVLDNLQTLNSSLWAWIEGEYHNSPHRGLEEGRTPLEQWALASADVRYPDATLDLDDLFLFEVKRRVYKDRTVSLNGRVYEVDALLVGQNVILRYDPAAPPSRPLDVVHDGKPAGKATALDAYANTAVRRTYPAREIEADDPAPEPPPSPLAMRNLKDKKEDE